MPGGKPPRRGDSLGLDAWQVAAASTSGQPDELDEVHFKLRLPGLAEPLIMRFRSASAVDRLVLALDNHRRIVFPDDDIMLLTRCSRCGALEDVRGDEPCKVCQHRATRHT